MAAIGFIPIDPIPPGKKCTHVILNHSVSFLNRRFYVNKYIYMFIYMYKLQV